MTPSKIDRSKDRTVYKEMDVDGNFIIERWRFMNKTKKLTYDIDRCVGCSLCFVVCPNRAIEIGPVPDIAQGLIEDMPPVLIDTEKCSFCFMCERVCINSVTIITDEDGNEIDKSEFPKLPQLWKFNKETCTKEIDNEYCSLCEKIRDQRNIELGRHYSKDLKKVIDNCPSKPKSMVFISPFKGSVTLLENQLHKCDPNGCKACVNICPTESFFIPQTAEDIVKFGKIACNEDTCMYCGACENSCPEKLIIVNRESISMDIPKEAEKTPWIRRWKRQFNNLLLTREQLDEKIRKEQNEVLFVDEIDEIEEVFEQISPSQPFLKDEYKKEREKNAPILKKINDSFNKANVRYFIHNNKKNKLKNYLKKHL
ncbi:MAG: 4Fe-4S dicluster domain-containing protein [archaeon]|nr:4Fe-4S dicluster domain-containing protein [archaeon]